MVCGLLVASCTTERPHADAPTVLGVIASGTAAGKDWRAELVPDDKNRGTLCTRVMLDSRAVSQACPPPADTEIPLNFVIDQSSANAGFLYGVVSNEVRRLSAQPGEGPSQEVTIKSFSEDPKRRYFAFAFSGKIPTALHAYGERGEELANGDSKLQQARQSSG